MRTVCRLLLGALLISGCASEKTVKPLPFFSLDDLSDRTFPASFRLEDFNWRGSNLTATVFSETFYDAADMKSLRKGDTIIYDGSPMTVTRLEKDSPFLSVNGGLTEGGADFKDNGDGTFSVVLPDDHPLYKEIGETELFLDEDFIIIDCGIEPQDPVDTVRTMQKYYLECLEGYRKDFTELNTRITTEDGVLKVIRRFWIP